MSQQIEKLHESARIFAGSDQPFPSYLTTTPDYIELSQGVADLDTTNSLIPASLSVNPTKSCVIQQPGPTPEHSLLENDYPQSSSHLPTASSSFSAIPMQSSYSQDNGSLDESTYDGK